MIRADDDAEEWNGNTKVIILGNMFSTIESIVMTRGKSCRSFVRQEQYGMPVQSSGLGTRWKEKDP